MNQKLFLLLGITIFFLGGCSLAPEYTQPEAPVPVEWPQGVAYKSAQAAPGATTATELSRREFFADARLQKLIEIALNNNRDLRLAALNVERARALYGIQRAELLPTVNAVGTGSKQRVPADLSSTNSATTTEQYGVNLGISSWEIDFFGRIRSLKDQALEEYLATEEARRSAQIALVSEVASVYLTLAADRGNLKLAQSTLETQQEAYDLIQRRYDVGVATELDLRRAQIPVDAARGDVARFAQLVAQDQNALNLLAGSPVPKEFLPEDLSIVNPLKDISPGLSSEVLLNRPDILQAEHRLKGAYAFIGAARAAFFPRISLTTSVGTASDELSGLFSSGSAAWSFVPRITMPIFDARTWAAL
ncbi:MAG: efflux transporter outer membrane subunit, partial [Deltaproteobacteria bacterium]|nr:efflux transporter outer membrane subunit [Deltaproteobacteria bacterium]